MQVKLYDEEYTKKKSVFQKASFITACLAKVIIRKKTQYPFSQVITNLNRIINADIWFNAQRNARQNYHLHYATTWLQGCVLCIQLYSVHTLYIHNVQIAQMTPV